MEILLVLHIFVVTIGAVAIVFQLPENFDIEEKAIMFGAIGVFVRKLFQNKNPFGVILSILLLTSILPSICIVAGVQVLLWLIEGAVYVWKLGNRR